MSDINELTFDEAAEPELAALRDEVEDLPEVVIAPEEEPTQLPEKAYLDTERGVFVCLNGVEFNFKHISYLFIERLMNDTSGKPKVPVVSVVIGGKYRKKEANPKDPDYVAALKTWESEHQMRLFRYLFSNGIDVDVPDDKAQEYREYFPGASDAMVTYLYVVECLENDEDAIAALADAVMGQSMPTQPGLQESADSFRR